MQTQRRCKRCGLIKDWVEFRKPFDNAYPCKKCENIMEETSFMTEYRKEYNKQYWINVTKPKILAQREQAG